MPLIIYILTNDQKDFSVTEPLLESMPFVILQLIADCGECERVWECLPLVTSDTLDGNPRQNP